MSERCRPNQYALHVQAKGGIGQYCSGEAVVQGDANEEADASRRTVDGPSTPACSTKGDQCCSTKARQQQGFRHWLGQPQQEAQYNAGRQQ